MRYTEFFGLMEILIIIVPKRRGQHFFRQSSKKYMTDRPEGQISILLPSLPIFLSQLKTPSEPSFGCFIVSHK